MSRVRASRRQITAAERGQIVQRILVDGWSAAEAAVAFRVGERQVARWVAAYRRHGMASLRSNAAGEPAPRRWIWRLRTMFGRLLAGAGGQPEAEPARCITLRRDGADPPSRQRR